MKTRRNAKSIVIIALIVLLCILSVTVLAGCGGGEPEATPTPTPTLPPPPPPSTTEPTPEPVTYAPYNGIIEHIFFHEVIAWPELAWGGGSRQEHFDSEFVTANEFWQILRRLYQNGYILINLNDAWSTYMTDTGHYRMQQVTLTLPTGKKPLVISFDNLVFPESNAPFGFMSKYVIGPDGEVWAEGTDPNGVSVVSQDLTVITLLDKFISENPGFSHDGAKGCIALSGIQGILGYRTNKVDDDDSQETRLNRMREVALVSPIVEKLKETGWYFASHTYSRSSLGNMTLERVQTDAQRWQDEVGTLVGETAILTYPASSRLDGRDQDEPGPAMQYYVSQGFRFFAAYGSRYYVQNKSENYNITAVIMDRAFMCGTTFRHHRGILERFFDAKEIFDPTRPDEYGNSWE